MKQNRKSILKQINFIIIILLMIIRLKYKKFVIVNICIFIK